MDDLILKVIEGPQKGSTQTLPVSRQMTIGSSFDNDICFLSDSDETYKLELIPGRVGVVVSLIEGDAICDNQSMDIGERYKISFETPVSVGSSTFVVVQSLSTSASDYSPDPANTEIKSSGSRASIVAFVAIVGGLLFSGGTFALYKERAQSPVPIVNNPSLMDLVNSYGNGFVQVEPGPTGNYRITGYFPNTAEKQRLQSALQEHANSIEYGVYVDSEIADAVREIYRVNEMVADVTVLSSGRIRVSTQTNELEILERIEAAANADIPGIQELIRDNVPVLVEQPVVVPAYTDLPGKRIVLIVSSDPAYVLTEDDSQYFVGSLLPTGHKIKSITSSLVTLEKEGIESELVF